MPFSVQLDILPMIISPLKGRKTTRRNSTGRPSVNFVAVDGGPFGDCTVNIDETVTMSDESIRDFQKIVHTNAESNLLNHLEGRQHQI